MLSKIMAGVTRDRISQGFVAAIFPLHEIFWLHTSAVEEDGFLTADGYNFSMTHNSGHAFLSQMQDDIFSDAVQKYQ